jgi:NADH-quinone oxidoreductase subunit I
MKRIYGYGLFRSMRISFRNFFRKPITVQYPHERVELPERSRWAVRMKYDEDGQHKCTACLACERACPDYIIQIDVTTGEARKKHIDRWRYEIGACMMCGLCVEACPFDAILMSHDYELARIDPATLVEDLLVDVAAVGPKRKEPAAAMPVAEKAVPESADAAPEPAAGAPDAPAAPTEEGCCDD